MHLTAHERLERAAQGMRPALRAPARMKAARAPSDRLGLLAVLTIGAYLFAKQFYFFSGGSIQPADGLITVMALFVVGPRGLGQFLRQQPLLTAMTIWIALVNFTWFAITGVDDYLIVTLYYIFNLFVVLAVFSTRLDQPDLFDRMVPWFIFAAILVQTAAVYYLGESGGIRSTGTFRNPNQLAYWGVCTFSLLMILRNNQPKLVDLPFLLMVLYCEAMSASRAGVVATAVLMLIWLYFALRTPALRLAGVAAGVVGACLLVLSGTISAERVIASDARISARLNDNRDGSQIEERNYDRIIDNYEYIVLGAGEGNNQRWGEGDESALEIHSSFGTMLFSYGLPGLALFMAFLALVTLRAPSGLAVYLLPPILYGITHQGLRFSFFWIVIGVLLAIGEAARRRRVSQRPLYTGRRLAF